VGRLIEECLRSFGGSLARTLARIFARSLASKAVKTTTESSQYSSPSNLQPLSS
jgi:hypothetical protein